MKRLPIQDCGESDSIAVIRERVKLQGRFVIDVGCGDMTFSQKLVEAGARVLAIDPDAEQAVTNRAAETPGGLKFLETTAESLPLEDNTLDGVCFSFSLHHIPESSYSDVFDELFRILKPGGFLFAIEPTDCPLNDVMKLFHDETHVRRAAQDVLHERAVPKFSTAESVTYHSYVQYDGWEYFAKRFASRSFNNLYSEADVRQPEVQAAFEAAGAPDYRFFSPKLTMCLLGFQG